MALDSETLDQLLSTVRRFVQARLVPNEQRVADEDAIPDDIVAEMRSLGLFGLSIPAEYGGLGLNMTEEVRVTFELGQTSPVFRSRFGTNIGIGSQGIVIDGTRGAEARSTCRSWPPARSPAPSPSPSPTPAPTPPRCAPAPGATATTTSSTAPSASSPTRRRPASSRSWRAPIRRRRVPPASPPSWSKPARPASSSARPTARWASAATTPATSSSRTAACPPAS